MDTSSPLILPMSLMTTCWGRLIMSRRVVFANSTHKAPPPAPLDFRHFVVVLFLLNVALVLPVTSQGGGMGNTGRIDPHNENGQEILPEIKGFERALSESGKRLRVL